MIARARPSGRDPAGRRGRSCGALPAPTPRPIWEASRRRRDSAIWWLLTLTGSLGVFVVADIASFYLVFTLASLCRLRADRPRRDAARPAGRRSLCRARVLGEACLLLAFVMLASGSPAANPLIRDVVATLPASPMRDGIVSFVILGFALKMGLVPLHVWLPLAHPAAPMPASAVLSGVVVKAGVIGLDPLPAFRGGTARLGRRRSRRRDSSPPSTASRSASPRRAKTILAYSTVSQMGLLAAMLGIGLANADAERAEPRRLLRAAPHAGEGRLVPGGRHRGGDRRRSGCVRVLIVTALLALSLGGLPLTSGALAKLATKPMLGYGLAGQALTLAAAGSTLLMLHFLTTLSGEASRDAGSRAPSGEVIPWLVVSALSVVHPVGSLPPRHGGNGLERAPHRRPSGKSPGRWAWARWQPLS